MADLYFGLIHQNISTKKASFHYQGCPLSLKSGKLWQAEIISQPALSVNPFWYDHQLT
jgi:hypothetical protein